MRTAQGGQPSPPTAVTHHEVLLEGRPGIHDGHEGHRVEGPHEQGLGGETGEEALNRALEQAEKLWAIRKGL